MRFARMAALPLLLAAVTSDVLTQARLPGEPTFEVVSIKPNVGGSLNSSSYDRPDGGFTRTNIPVSTLITRAYPPAIPIEMIGLPEWARTERYDVIATSSLSRPTPDDRVVMLRAMLADRFKLAVHFEKRNEPAYDLVFARSDGRLGPGITPTEIDCAAQLAAEGAAADAALIAGTPPPSGRPADLKAPPPRCRLRIVNGERMEGDTTMATLVAAGALRSITGRYVVDKTGLTGFYRVTMNFDRNWPSRGRPAPAVPRPDAAVSIFTALEEQLGLKLESTRAEQDRLVIDRIEPPMPD